MAQREEVHRTRGVEKPNASQVLESATLATEEVNLFLVDVRKDLNNPEIHAYSQVYVHNPLIFVHHYSLIHSRSVCGRKPQVKYHTAGYDKGQTQWHYR